MNPHDYEHFAAGLDDDVGIAVAINSVAAPASSTRASGQFGTEPLPKSTVVLKCGADLTPEPVQWLWPDWLALGKFHLLAGAPGQGKTTIAMGMAATVTIGGRWPDGSRCAAGNVLIWSGEDDYTDSLARAKQHLLNHDDRAAGVYARAAFEGKLKSYCEKQRIAVQYQSNPSKMTTEMFWTGIKDRLAADGKLVNAQAQISAIEAHRKVVLNPLSHENPTTLTEAEIRGAITAIEELNAVLR